MKTITTKMNIGIDIVRLSMYVIIITIVMLTSGCFTSNNIDIIKTKLPAVYGKGYVYFFRRNSGKEDFEQGNDFVLTRYDIYSKQEEILAKTNMGYTPRLYNGNIYYFENESSNICAINERNLKVHTAFSPDSPALFKVCFADTGNEFVYLESGQLTVKHGKIVTKIEHVYDFAILDNTIYYVIDDFSNDKFYINKITDGKNAEAEKIIDIQNILDIGKSDIKGQSRISQINADKGILYILITDDIKMNELYSYNLADKKINRIGKGCIYEYQVKDSFVYCRERDDEMGGQNLKRYDSDGGDDKLLIKDTTTFAVFDDNIIMYTLPHDNNLYVKDDDDINIKISDLLWFESSD